MAKDVGSIQDPCAHGLTYPELAPHEGGSAPVLPSEWSATALLHPYSPPPVDELSPQHPFFQLCTASLAYREGKYFSAQITGCENGKWWYVVLPDRTELSRDEGASWTTVDMGWTLPSTSWFGAQTPVCAGTSPLNWMGAQDVDWWKMPVVGTPASTWLWFDSETDVPVRLMFGQPPPRPLMGNPAQLALFQMFSFTYFPTFVTGSSPEPPSWAPAEIEGFAAGNPANYDLVEWNENFGMTTLMTPVNEASNPLPTRVLYRWTADAAYAGLIDRAQSTLMWYSPYNPSSPFYNETALMFGVAPEGIAPPPYSGSSLIVDKCNDGTTKCAPMDLGEEPPWWASIESVDGRVHANIHDNPTLCPNEDVAVIGVLFPPSDEYPRGRYLWTWYSPLAGTPGRHARPVTFMESASTIAEGGTSLALADYFDYAEFSEPIDPACFAVPSECPIPLHELSVT